MKIKLHRQPPVWFHGENGEANQRYLSENHIFPLLAGQTALQFWSLCQFFTAPSKKV